MKKVRMLVAVAVAGVMYKPNQLVAFPDDLAKPLIASGEADASKEAIAYCENELKVEAIVHESAADTAANEAADKLEAELAGLRKAHRREKDAEKKAALARQIEAASAQLEGRSPADGGGQK